MQELPQRRPTASEEIEAAPAGTIPDHHTGLRRFQQDADYFEDHYEELLAQYAGQWIAIYQQQVVGAAVELADLLAALTERGIPVGQTLVEFVADQEELLVV